MPAFTSEADNDGDSDLASKVGFLDVKTTQIEPQYLGPSSTFSFAHIINASLRGAIAQRPGASHESPNHAEAAPIPCAFPDYSVAVKLSNAYFENIQPQYPFLHEPTFRHYEQKLFKQSSDIPNIIIYSVPLFFINMVSGPSRSRRHKWLIRAGVCRWCSSDARLSLFSRGMILRIVVGHSC